MNNLSGNQYSDNNIYDEYIWIDTKYEKIGSTDIDLANYSTKDESQGYANTAESNAKAYADEKITILQDLTTNINFTRSNLAKYNVSLYKFGRVIILYLDVATNASNEYAFSLGELPAEARPKVNTSQNILDNEGEFCYFYCDANGDFGFRYKSHRTKTVGIRNTMFFISEM